MSRSNAVVRVKKVNSPALTYDSHFCIVKKIITGLGVLHFYTVLKKNQGTTVSTLAYPSYIHASTSQLDCL